MAPCTEAPIRWVFIQSVGLSEACQYIPCPLLPTTPSCVVFACHNIKLRSYCNRETGNQMEKMKATLITKSEKPLVYLRKTKHQMPIKGKTANCNRCQNRKTTFFGYENRSKKWPKIPTPPHYATNVLVGIHSCLKQGQGLSSQAAPPYLRFCQVPPPPPSLPKGSIFCCLFGPNW